MKIYNMGKEVPNYPFKDLQDQWPRPLLWVVYSYSKVRKNGGGYLVAWDGHVIIEFDLWHHESFSPFAHFVACSCSCSQDHFLNDDTESRVETKPSVVLKAKKLILHDKSGLDAPDCVVADWYEDKGKMAYAEILRLDESGMSEVREASEICFSDRPQPV